MKEQSVFEFLNQSLQMRGAALVAVSKTHPIEAIEALYSLGQRRFAENRVQEMLSKAEVLPADIEWHLIGHLQTNKVKFIAPFVSVVQSVDILKLLQEIDKQAEKHQRTIRCLLQFHIAREETKFGFSAMEAMDMLASYPPDAFPHVVFGGVMGMATFTEDAEQVRAEFRTLKSIFDQLRQAYFGNNPDFCELSMGMSGDWQIAVEEGSTMVRIGSLLFGQRPQN
jgi:pyridoxal phosphate enzyme (YggS family)